MRRLPTLPLRALRRRLPGALLFGLVFGLSAGALAAPVQAAAPSPDPPVGGHLLGTPGVVAHAPGDLPGPPPAGGAAYVVADLDTHAVLAASAPHTTQPAGGLLRMLRASVLLPRLDPRARYRLTVADAGVRGPRVGLAAGAEYTVDQLFFGLLLGGGADAGHALAAVSGGGPAVATLAAHRARDLGAYDTQVRTSPVDPAAQTSAYDLALIAQAALRRADFRRYAATTSCDLVPLDAPAPVVRLRSRDSALADYPGLAALVTGSAGAVVAAERGDHRLLVSILGTPATATPATVPDAAAALLDWGFAVGTDLEAVGRLVTPDDVARSARLRTSDRSRRPTADDTGGTAHAAAHRRAAGKRLAAPVAAGTPAVAAIPDPDAGPPGSIGGVPLWLALLSVAFLTMLAVRLREAARRRRHPQP